jgi:hypothetical protein
VYGELAALDTEGSFLLAGLALHRFQRFVGLTVALFNAEATCLLRASLNMAVVGGWVLGQCTDSCGCSRWSTGRAGASRKLPPKKRRRPDAYLVIVVELDLLSYNITPSRIAIAALSSMEILLFTMDISTAHISSVHILRRLTVLEDPAGD